MINLIACAVLLFSSNPYCPAPASTPPVAPACDDDSHMDGGCLSGCKATYAADVAAAYANGCSLWDGAWASYNSSVEGILDGLTSCLAGATTPAQRSACRNNAADAIEQASGILQAKLDMTSYVVNAGVLGARADYAACAGGCCVHN